MAVLRRSLQQLSVMGLAESEDQPAGRALSLFERAKVREEDALIDAV